MGVKGTKDERPWRQLWPEKPYGEEGNAEETECMERSELLLFGALDIVKILNLSYV